MGGGVTIRSAAEQDLPALASLKALYMKSCYRGYVQAERLDSLCAGDYLPQFTAWYLDPACMIEVLEVGGTIDCYVVSSLSGEAGKGLIIETRARFPGSTDTDRLMIGRALEALKARNCTRVQTWILKANYRARFLYEACGFHTDGLSKSIEIRGSAYEMLEYQYRMPETHSLS